MLFTILSGRRRNAAKWSYAILKEVYQIDDDEPRHKKEQNDLLLMVDVLQLREISSNISLKKLQRIAVKRLLDRALWKQGIRHTLPEGKKGHEWRGGHGYRKFYKSRVEQAMKPANVEVTMGHDLGTSES